MNTRVVRAVPATLLPIAGLAYEAALDTPRWAEFLRQFAHAMQSPAAVLWAHDFSTQTSDLEGKVEGIGLSMGFDASAMNSFESHYCQTNVWLQNPLMHKAGTVVNSSSLFNDALLPKTEWHTDWLRPQDLFYSCAAVVEHANDRSFNITVLRSRAAGAYSPQELAWLEQLMPHLRTALALHRKLHTTQALASASVALLDTLPLGAILLDAQGCVLHANTRAQALMQQSQLLHVQNRRVHSTQTSHQQWLEHSIRQCLLLGQYMGQVGSAVWQPPSAPHDMQGRRLQHRNGQQLHVMVAPMPCNAQPYGMPCGAVVLLSDPCRLFTSISHALRSYYRMTQAEAKLVQALINGLSPQEYAQEAGLSIHTVRSHCKTAAAKAGVSRQADLVRVVLMGPALLDWQQTQP